MQDEINALESKRKSLTEETQAQKQNINDLTAQLQGKQ